MRPRRSNQQGYSLAEALVVVAIIGLVTMVVVPNFISLYRSAQVKGAVMRFTNDLRASRQRAVTTYRPVMVSVGTSSTDKFSYWISTWDGTAWTTATRRDLETETAASRKKVYFSDLPVNGYTDSVNSDSRIDIIFETNGGVRSPPENPTMKIKTDLNVGKSVYTITVYSSGSVKAE
jgi:type II secretion system protein H